jgi:hypothetical protein
MLKRVMTVTKKARAEWISSRESLPPAEKGLLHHVLGVGHASQHAVGDREE